MTITITDMGTITPVHPLNPTEQNDPSIAALAGGYVVVWTSYFQDGNGNSGTGVYGQRFANDGTKLNTEFLINTNTAGDQLHASVAALAGSGFVVTWEGPFGSGTGVYGQRYASSGVKAGGEFLVTSTLQPAVLEPTITGLAGGGYVVTWQSPVDGSGSGVYGQIYGNNNSKLGGAFLVNTTTASHQVDPSIVALAAGGFVVTWTSQLQDGSGQGIYAQQFSATGVKQGPEIQVNTTTAGDQLAPSIAKLASGGFVIAWHDTVVHAQVFDASGVKVGAEVNVSNGGDSLSQVVGLPDGGFMVTWKSGLDFEGRNFDSAGVPVTDVYKARALVSVTTPDHATAVLANGNIALAFGIGAFVPGTPHEVFQQIISPGLVLASTQQLAVGDDADDLFNVNQSIVNLGDIFDGGGGHDTIILQGGSYDFDDSAHLVSIEAIEGLPTHDLHLTMSAESLAAVTSIDLGDNYDTISLQTSNTAYDFSKFTMSGVDQIGAYGTGQTLDFWSPLAPNTALRTNSSTNAFVFHMSDFSGLSYSVDQYSVVPRVYLAPGDGSLIEVTGYSTVHTLTSAQEVINAPSTGALILTSDGAEAGDVLVGGAGVDELRGLSGATLDLSALQTFSGIEIVRGQADQTLIARADQLTGLSILGFGGVQLAAPGTLNLSGVTLAGSRQITGSSGADAITGTAGDDTITGGAGADAIDGGAGIDTASYAGAAAGVNANLSAGQGITGDALGDTLTGIENLTGSAHNDRLTGNAGANVINGGGGSDVINGAGGSDTAVFAGARDQYEVLTSANGNLIVHHLSAGHITILANVELLQFANISQTAAQAIVNQPSVATSASVNRTETNLAADLDASGQLTVTDIDGSPAFVAQVNTAGLYGTFSIGADGAWSYAASSAHDQLAPGQPYLDVFTVSTTDGAQASVTISITGSNDGPSISGTTSGSVTEDAAPSTASGQLTANDADLGATAAWSVVGSTTGTYGSFAISATGQWTYTIDHTAAQPLSGSDQIVETFTVKVDDGQGGSATQSITVTVNGADESLVGIVGSPGPDTLTGTAGADTIIGLDGDDTLIGLAGADTLDGGAGVDTASYAGAAAGVNVNLSAGQGFMGDALGDTLTGIENLTGSAHNDRMTGDAGANVIVGGGGSDVINGAGGSDTAVFSGARDQYEVLKSANGNLTVHHLSAGEITILANVEFLQFANITQTAAQAIVNQPAVVSPASVNRTETNLAADLAASGQLTITDIDSPATFVAQANTAGSYGTFSIGADGAWYYTATSTHDELAPGQTYTDVFTVSASDGTQSSVTISIVGSNDGPSISGTASGSVTEEAATLTASGQLTATDADLGATAAWSVVGSAAGAYGAFALSASGQWTYTLDNTAAQPLAASDHVVENFTVMVDDGQGGSATQIVAITVNGADEAGAPTNGPDSLTGGAGADTLSGLDGADVIDGLAGADTLNGDAGDDVIDGGTGNDTLNGGAGIDTLSYATATGNVIVSLKSVVAQNTGLHGTDTIAGFENLTGSSKDDALRGDDGANVINGGMGSDKIYGDIGADSLYGGSGADTFVYGSLAVSTVAAGGRDTIFDFARAQGDRIDLAGIDARTGAGNDAFTLVAAFTGVAGQLTATFVVDHYEVAGDVNGDGVADFAIDVYSGVALGAQDFVL